MRSAQLLNTVTNSCGDRWRRKCQTAPRPSRTGGSIGSAKVPVWRLAEDPRVVASSRTTRKGLALPSGFYLSSETAEFDEHDYQNTVDASDGIFLRGGVYPINVAEPLLWLARCLTTIEE